MRIIKNKKAKHHALATVAIVGLVGVIGLFMVFMGQSGSSTLVLPSGGVTGMVASDAGACVILPDRGGSSVRSGDGFTNSNNVCDASVNGCGFCLEQCQPFNKVVDKFDCPPCAGDDGFCNEAVCGTSDLDCQIIGACITSEAGLSACAAEGGVRISAASCPSLLILEFCTDDAFECEFIGTLQPTDECPGGTGCFSDLGAGFCADPTACPDGSRVVGFCPNDPDQEFNCRIDHPGNCDAFNGDPVCAQVTSAGNHPCLFNELTGECTEASFTCT